MTRWPTLDGLPPRVIAHRGASGPLPEHTLAGYALGLAQGADVIEPDLLPSSDGVLFCRHDIGLRRSTDVAGRDEFAAHAEAGDWPIHALPAAMIDTLRAIQPFASRDAAHDGLHPPLRFSAAIEWAARAAGERGQPVVLYPEIKHPSRLAAAGIDPVPLFIEAVKALPAGVEVQVQCFEAEPLRRVFEATGMACTLLLDADADVSAAMALHRDWLAALGVNKILLGEGDADSGLIAAAHAAGLRVDAWTFRDDQPAAGGSVEDELARAMRRGVDGVFCDFPATGVAVRAALATALQAQSARSTS